MQEKKMNGRDQQRQLCIVVVHGYHQPETICLYGETVEWAYFMIGNQEFPLYLSFTGLLILDCLCRYRGTPLSVARIERILSSDPFYLRHGANTKINNRKAAMPKRRAIKVYIQRIRIQLTRGFHDAGMTLDASQVLISETTDSNIVTYRLKANVEFFHSPG